MITTAEKFLKELKDSSSVPHLVIAWGDEAYYKDRIRENIEGFVFKDVAETDRSVQNFAQSFDLTALGEAINTYPFFSGSNFVVIKDPKLLEKERGDKVSEKRKTELKAFTDVLSDIPEYTYVICLCEKVDKRQVFYKTLSAKGAVVECTSMKYYSLKPWLDSQAEKYGAKFDYQAEALIIEYMSVTDSVPLLLLEGEIEKLSVYAGTRKIWTAKDVENIFSQLPEVSGFALGSNISSHKLGKVLELLEVEKKKGSGNFIPVLARVSYEIRKLARVKEFMEKGYGKDRIAAELHMHPFAVDKTMEGCRRFKLRRLEGCLIALNDLNMQMRNGGRQWPRLEEILVTLLDA